MKACHTLENLWILFYKNLIFSIFFERLCKLLFSMWQNQMVRIKGVARGERKLGAFLQPYNNDFIFTFYMFQNQSLDKGILIKRQLLYFERDQMSVILLPFKKKEKIETARKLYKRQRRKIQCVVDVSRSFSLCIL